MSGLPAIRELPAPPARKAPKASKDHKVSKACKANLVLQVRKVRKVNKAQQVPRVRKVRKANLGPKVLRDCKVRKGFKVFKASLVRKESKVNKARKVSRVCKGIPVKTALQRRDTSSHRHSAIARRTPAFRKPSIKRSLTVTADRTPYRFSFVRGRTLKMFHSPAAFTSPLPSQARALQRRSTAR